MRAIFAATFQNIRPFKRGDTTDVLVGYDVDTTGPEGRRRLRRVAIACQNYGQRVQFSLFECRVGDAWLEQFEAQLLEIIDPRFDSLRIYILRGGREGVVRTHGRDRYRDFDDPLIL